ncbi:nuclear transport factor 2 family protein [Pseudidiomarina sp. 1APR75-15]|uniref:Nuclear transport factor 2 family protein n=1 Tax=Pseudidiomarina terrestris TaxID=2820060 RepID=A0ABT8MI99_9GAMM|nr:nuclear transport factor 2 family protein [Pseudidiomarina sp. 1APR75-15]MDN7129665.1 nuclear transport factor 2 family protein [Pseudidiomarina sp. 1APR75-15]
MPLVYSFIVYLALAVLPAQADSLAVERAGQVHSFMAAFNAHDSERMAEHVTDNVEWLSVNGTKIVVETRGKANLISAMDAYFKSCSSCQSELLEVMVSGSRVSTVERATWQSETEQAVQNREQRSIAVYEFAGDLIQRVYYFPAD